jgi:hypothetical protein
LKTASLLECWVFWFLHAHEYEPEELLKLFPQPGIQQATQAIRRIAEKTEDKLMYDAREKAIRDQLWAVSAARREGEIEGEIMGEIKGKIEGEIKGKIELIRTLEGILNMPLSDEQALFGMQLDQLESLANSLQARARNRTSQG